MSVLAEKINRFNEVSKEFIQAGFVNALKAGELLEEVFELVGAEGFSEWLKENTEIPEYTAKGYIDLFKGKRIKVEAFQAKEEQEKQ